MKRTPWGYARRRLQAVRRCHFRRFGILAQRKIDVENGAAAFRVLEPDHAMVLDHDIPDDVKAKPAAVLLPGIAGIGLGKLLEQMRLELLRNARAMVANRQACV